MLNVAVTLGVYAIIGWNVWHIQWSWWFHQIIYYGITRPYLPTNVNRSLNLVLGSLITYIIIKAVYNRRLHPLSDYKGPLLHSVSSMSLALDRYNGRLPQSVHRLHQKHGPVVRIAPDEISYTDPRALHDILEQDRGLSAFRTAEQILIYGSGPLPDPAKVRVALAPAFTEEAVAAELGLVGSGVAEMIARIERSWAKATSSNDDAAPEHTSIDLGKYLSLFVFRSLAILTLGSPVNDFHVDKAGYKDQPAGSFLHSLPLFRKAVVQRQAVKECNIALEKVVKLPDLDDALAPSRIMQTTSLAKIKQRIQLGQSRGDIVGHLIDAEGDAVDEDARISNIELMTRFLILHGHDTIACVLQGALILLLQKPAKMRKLTDEVRARCSQDESGQVQGAQDLPYLNAVLQETMRLIPPVAEPLRRKADTEVTICGRSVPKDTVVSISQYAIQRSPAHFTYASTFIPERWLPTSSPLLEPTIGDPFFSANTFPDDRFDVAQPFSTGIGSCTGQTIAMSLTRTILASLVWAFDIEAVPNSKPIEWDHMKYYVRPELPPVIVRLRKRSSVSKKEP